MDAERRLGFLPKDVSDEKRGYDLESSIPGTGRLRFIEVKGRAAGAKTVTVTKNEILTALNKPDEFILAIVEYDGRRQHGALRSQSIPARARFRSHKLQLRHRGTAPARGGSFMRGSWPKIIRDPVHRHHPV